MSPEERDRLRAEMINLLEAERQEELALRLEETHPTDIAALLRELGVEDRARVFRLLAQQQAGAVLHETDDQSLLELVRALDEDESDGDPGRHAARTTPQRSSSDLPEAEAEKLLDLMEEEGVGGGPGTARVRREDRRSAS